MTKNQKKKAFGYIRVSTAMQVEGGYSLDDQENRIRQHAKANDMTLVDIFRDEGKSGKNISGRPGFQKMLEAIRNGQKIDYVLVTRLSRFGRNASDVLTALKTLQSHGVALWCIEDMLDSSTKMGDAMLKMSSIFAEMERENIREQTRAGRYEKARQGKWNGGQAPYGYQIGRNADGTSSGVLVVDKDEAKVVRQIFDWYVNDNVGIAGISTRLNENGVRRTPRGNGSQSFFTPYAVKKIIENPVYAGKIRYGVRKSTFVEGSDNVYRPKAQDDYKVYEGLHEAIVDDETFRRAKERRDRESFAFPRKRDNHVSILSGLLICPVCGHGLISTHTKGRTKKDGTPGKDTYGYRCRYTRASHGAICTFTKQIPQHVLHAEADELFEMIWRDTNLFGQVIEDTDKAMDMKKLKDEAERLTKLISGCDRRISKLSETIDRLDPDDSAYDRKYDDMQARLDSLYEEREHLEDEKVAVDDKMAARQDLRDTIERVANDVTKALQGLYQMSDEEKAVLYHQMFEHFELNPDANYRKGERVIKKAFLRVPITYGDESVDAFVPGDGSGNSWVPDNSRVKDNNVEKITQRAATIDDDQLNRYFNTVVYTCLDWDAKEKVTNFNIYEHTLNWASRNIFRRGYLFLGTPENRPTAQPPEDYYIYFLPPYGDTQYTDEKKADEVFFSFKHNEEFKGNLRLYAAALMMKEMAEEKNKPTYAAKAEVYRKKLTKYFSDNKSTCFEVIYKGEKRQLLEVLKGQYKITTPFKETMDLAASISLDGFFATKYPDYPKFRTQITIKNQAEVIRACFDRFAGKQDKMADYLLDSFDLIDNGKITVANSKYAKYYIDMLNKLPAGSVINFSDIYEETFDGYVDKRFKISYALMPVVFFAMVYTGNAVMAINGGKTITASDLDVIPKTSVLDIYDFKYISKPKDVQLAELVHLFEVLNLPTGLMTNPAQREAGLAQLLEKAKEIVNVAVKAASKLNGDFTLWGEKLIPDHIATTYKDSGKRVLDVFANFGTRFNTVAKLPNFLYTKEEIDQIEKDIQNVNIIMEYDRFRTELTPDISYMMNLDRMDLGKTITEALEAAKDRFHEIRDAIPEDMDGEGAAADVKEILDKVKKQYIDLYMEEHSKKRLNVIDAKKKGEIISSTKLANLKKLKTLSIFSAAKVDAIDTELASLKVCYDLTSDMLLTTHFCTKCNFVLGSSDAPVKGKIADIEDRIDTLLDDWSQTLYNTLSDPLLGEQMTYLKPQQRTVIDQFLKTKKLPEKVDNYFVEAVSALLEGFEPVSISAEEFIDKLDALGPCDIDTFKNKINDMLKAYTKGKDAEKLRIVVKR